MDKIGQENPDNQDKIGQIEQNRTKIRTKIGPNGQIEQIRQIIFDKMDQIGPYGLIEHKRRKRCGQKNPDKTIQTKLDKLNKIGPKNLDKI